MPFGLVEASETVERSHWKWSIRHGSHGIVRLSCHFASAWRQELPLLVHLFFVRCFGNSNSYCCCLDDVSSRFFSVWTYFSAMAITAALEVTDWTSLSLKVWDGFVWVDLMLPFHPSKHSYDKPGDLHILGIPTKPTPEGPHSSSGAFLRWWLHQLFGLPSFDAKECHLIFFWDGTIQDLLHCKHLLEGSMQVSVRIPQSEGSYHVICSWRNSSTNALVCYLSSIPSIWAWQKNMSAAQLLKVPENKFRPFRCHKPNNCKGGTFCSFANKNIFWDSWVPSRPIIGWWSLA